MKKAFLTVLLVALVTGAFLKIRHSDRRAASKDNAEPIATSNIQDLAEPIALVSTSSVAPQQSRKKMERGVASTNSTDGSLASLRETERVTLRGNPAVTGEPPESKTAVPEFPADHWTDAGGATPQNAVQTFLWSLRTRNADRAVQLVDPADHQLLVDDGEGIAAELGKATGYSLLSVLEITPDQQMLRLRLDEANGETKTEEFHFVKIGGSWRFSETAKLAYLKAIENAK